MSTQLSAIDKLLMASQNTLASVDGLSDEVREVKGEMGAINSRVERIENNMTVDRRFQQNINAAAKKHVSQIVGGSKAPEFRSTIQWLWADYRQFFGVTSYLDTKVVDYDRAMEWIRDWRPIKIARPEMPDGE